jgi:hypothetical protein
VSCCFLDFLQKEAKDTTKFKLRRTLSNDQAYLPYIELVADKALNPYSYSWKKGSIDVKTLGQGFGRMDLIKESIEIHIPVCFIFWSLIGKNESWEWRLLIEAHSKHGLEI